MTALATHPDMAVRLRRGLPLLILALALSCVFWFGGARGHLHGTHARVWDTAKNMALAQNLTRSGLMFLQRTRNADGSIDHWLYHRFPIGGVALIKLAIWPFEGSLSAQLVAARTLMLVFFCGAALLAYSALFRLVGSRRIALAATLLAFSSYYMLVKKDVVTNECSMDLFALLLVFHAMVLFQQSRANAAARRGELALPKHPFRWLLAAVCIALLLGWHVFGLLAPFLAFGLAGEARAAWRRRASAHPLPHPRIPPLLRRLGAAAAAMARSRFTLLAVLAALFGACVLGYNLAREYAHVASMSTATPSDAQRAKRTRLPSWHSIRQRTGLRYRGDDGRLVRLLDWDAFLRWQFHRVGVMCLPFATTGFGSFAIADEIVWKHATAPTLAGLGVGATCLCFGGLLLLRRGRIAAGRGSRALLAVLALSGFCWALPMEGNTGQATHDHEAVFYIGVPLVLFALLAAGARHLWVRIAGRRAGGWALTACASLGAVLFALSSYRMAEALPAEPRQIALLREFERIRALARGKDVLVAATEFELGGEIGWGFGGIRTMMKAGMALRLHMAGAILQFAEMPADAARMETQGEVDFVLTFERLPLRSLRTPNHRFVFLYDAGRGEERAMDALAAARKWSYGAIAAREPLARDEFDIQLLPLSPYGPGARPNALRGAKDGGLALAYLKQPCRPEELGWISLIVVPAKLGDLHPLRRHVGHDRVVFRPHFYFGLFEDKCLFRVPLPDYPIRSIKTGSYGRRGPAWTAQLRIDRHNLRRARAAARNTVPAARGAFDLYLRDGALVYVRSPCAAADIRPRFFLHTTPAHPGALPAARRAVGFVNQDFDFNEHGARFNGECVATVPLPEYEVARLYTGQFDANGAIHWKVALVPSPSLP